MVSDQTLTELRTALRELEQKIIRLQAVADELSQAQTEFALLQRTVAMLERDRVPAPPTGLRIVNTDDLSIVDIIYQILKTSEKPLATSDIFKQYKAQGGHTNRATVAASLAKLASSGKIRRLQRGTYEAV
jgi:hypothetical protein